MKNQKVGTVVGAVVLVIISVTAVIFVWTYERSLPPVYVQPLNFPVTQSVTKSVSSESDRIETAEDCSGYEDEKRICKDGSVVDVFDSKCLPVLCSSGKVEENSKTSYYSPYIRKGQNIFVELPYDEGRASLVGADVATFHPVDICESGEMSAGYYAKDKNRVYAESAPVESIDINSFKYLGLLENGYGMPYSISIAVDKSHVYFGCGAVASTVDRNSFRILENGYSKDKNRIYHLNFVVSAADYDTFEVLKTPEARELQGNFALDKNHVFVEGQVLIGIDPKVCKSQGLVACLPDSWDELMDDSTQGERLSGSDTEE